MRRGLTFNPFWINGGLPKQEAPITTVQSDQIIRTTNEQAGFVEFLNDEVPTIVREIDGRCAILLDIDSRRVVGYRVYEPATEGLSNERLADMMAWAKSEQDECLADDRPVTAEIYGDVGSAVTELQTLRALVAETGSESVDDLRDMAIVGHSLMASIEAITKDGPYKDWAPAENPAEIVTDLLNDLEDALRASSGVKGLEWERVSEYRLEADDYTILIESQGCALYWREKHISQHKAAELAKATAEADYRQRILSCLSSPLPEVEPTFYGVWSVSGAHIGTWKEKHIAQTIFDLEYPDGKTTPLYASPLPTVEVAEAPRLPRLTEGLVYAAAVGHYGKNRVDASGGPKGIAMTVDGRDYDFDRAFRRMWKGLTAALSQNKGE